MKIRLPKIREVIEAVKALITGPYTSKFPAVPSIPPEGYRGVPKYYKEDCVGCGACSEVCPARAIDVEDNAAAKLRRLTHHQERCLYCGQCERDCITGKGIRLTLDYDLATTDISSAHTEIEKELVLCEKCGAIITAKDHLRWIHDKMGPLAFSNPTLLIAEQRELGLLGRGEVAENIHRRGSSVKILCPACRREVIFREHW
jgi:hydrogenase-4 component H